MNLTELPEVFRFGQAMDAGLTRAAIDAALERDELIWLRRGWYAVRRAPPEGERWEVVAREHLGRLQLELARRPGHVASHVSGALVHGLAVSLASDVPVHLTSVDRAPCSRREPGLVIHHSDSVENEAVELGSVRVTRMDRTVADYLRTQSLPAGLGLLDDALRRQLVDLPGIRQMLDRQVRWRGRPRALGVLQLADPARESWGESFSFGHLHLQGVAMPLHQVVVLDAEEKSVGRVDGLWPHTGVVGECDGQEKYRVDDGSGATPEERVLSRLHEESIRQQRMEALGLKFVRWSPSQVRDAPDEVAHRVKRAFAQGTPHRFTGWVVYQDELRKLPFTVETLTLDLERLRRRRPRRAARQ